MADELNIITSSQNPKCYETTKVVQQQGEKNTFINHADIVNVNIDKTMDCNSNTENEATYYKGNILSTEDSDLFMEFKNDYSEIMEYRINTDFSAELVRITLSDEIETLYRDKWRFKSKDFSNKELRSLKIRILKVLNDLTHYLSPEFLRLHENSGMLIFRNQSWEEGCRLRDDFQPNSFRIRKEIASLYIELYHEQFAEEDELLREKKDE